ncbi:hypothetical protein ATI61_105523 [Archangium gephyra]|uniref:Uncharacterized protein n=1 Tax=Archangium gephyra TaxID=48 RepID=A0ABX9K2Y9_9BACT|nr:hypothetical protein [Archangium gephyra]REG32195.1 hypothetical protein ATI61_105523 [Archangium gephyra]
MRQSMNEWIRPNRLARFLVRTAAGLLLTAGAPAVAASVPEQSYWQYTIEEGYSWRLVQINGYTEEGQYFSRPMYMIDGVDGLYNAPLPYSLREELLYSVDTENTSFSLSQEIVNEINASEQLGYLTPALQAIAEPLDGSDIEYYSRPGSGEESFGLFGRCDDKVVNKNKSFSISTPLNQNFNIGGGFSGNLSLTGDAQASAVGEIQVRQKRFKLFGACIPYGVKLDHARAHGSAMVNYGTTLSGTVNYNSPPWEWQLAKPFLFGFGFAIGPIPVYIGFNLPITAGLQFNASVTGSVTYNGAQAASGYFDYTCTLDSCNGYSNFSSSNLQGPQTLTGGVSGRIQPTIYAQLAIRGYLYDDSVAYAQVGVRPYLYGDLWGYYGNNCGDADGDGYFETVDALTFDLDWQIFITAQADSFLTKEKRWTLWTSPRWHLNYWDLIGSEALQPMLVGNASVPVNTTQTYNARMRPCWPYSDTVNYQLGWGDGSSSSLSGAPASLTPASHAWSSTGTKGLSLIAQSDSHGRQFNKTTVRNVQVTTGGGTATHMGMTWKARQQYGAYVNVGSDGQSNAYSGDTSPYTSLPILCLKKDGRPAPSGISFDFYNGWSGGEVRLSSPVTGSTLTSRATADGICASTYGSGWRMGEFHDGGGGWGWWAAGSISTTTRFWVAINDQPANPWN